MSRLSGLRHLPTHLRVEQHEHEQAGQHLIRQDHSRELDVQEALTALARVRCDIVTIGQYLQATKNGEPVKRYVTPQEFEAFRSFGLSLGIPYVYAAPFVRSSYMADEVLNACRQ